MSLPKLDVRLKLTPEAHALLKELADFDDATIERVGSLLLERAVISEHHMLVMRASRLSRLGINGKGGE